MRWNIWILQCKVRVDLLFCFSLLLVWTAQHASLIWQSSSVIFSTNTHLTTSNSQCHVAITQLTRLFKNLKANLSRQENKSEKQFRPVWCSFTSPCRRNAAFNCRYILWCTQNYRQTCRCISRLVLDICWSHAGSAGVCRGLPGLLAAELPVVCSNCIVPAGCSRLLRFIQLSTKDMLKSQQVVIRVVLIMLMRSSRPSYTIHPRICMRPASLDLASCHHGTVIRTLPYYRATFNN